MGLPSASVSGMLAVQFAEETGIGLEVLVARVEDLAGLVPGAVLVLGARRRKVDARPADAPHAGRAGRAIGVGGARGPGRAAARRLALLAVVRRRAGRSRRAVDLLIHQHGAIGEVAVASELVDDRLAARHRAGGVEQPVDHLEVFPFGRHRAQDTARPALVGQARAGRVAGHVARGGRPRVAGRDAAAFLGRSRRESACHAGAAVGVGLARGS